MSKDKLEKHYLDTTYSVFIADSKYNIKITEPVPSAIKEIINETKEKSAAILTAWNPKSHPLSLQENKDRNNALNTILKNKDYTVYSALGQGNELWPAEESFLIVGISKDDVEKIAVDFGQYAYVWLDAEKSVSLVFTSIWHSL